jgi:hypothetical protein
MPTPAPRRRTAKRQKTSMVNPPAVQAKAPSSTMRHGIYSGRSRQNARAQRRLHAESAVAAVQADSSERAGYLHLVYTVRDWLFARIEEANRSGTPLRVETARRALAYALFHAAGQTPTKADTRLAQSIRAASSSTVRYNLAASPYFDDLVMGILDVVLLHSQRDGSLVSIAPSTLCRPVAAPSKKKPAIPPHAAWVAEMLNRRRRD